MINYSFILNEVSLYKTKGDEVEKRLNINLPNQYLKFINIQGFAQIGNITIFGHEPGLEEYPSLIFINNQPSVKKLCEKLEKKYKTPDFKKIIIIGSNKNHLIFYIMSLSSGDVYAVEKITKNYNIKKIGDFDKFIDYATGKIELNKKISKIIDLSILGISIIPTIIWGPHTFYDIVTKPIRPPFL